MEQAALEVLDSRVMRPTKALRANQRRANRAVGTGHTPVAPQWPRGVWLMWGVVGSVGGLIMGYGVARTMRQTIHRLQVQVRDAADKLGQDRQLS